MFDTIETILSEVYTAAFCGLHNTRVFRVPLEQGPAFEQLLPQMGIRSIHFDGEKSSRVVCFTTGIQTDRPLDVNQV